VVGGKTRKTFFFKEKLMKFIRNTATLMGPPTTVRPREKDLKNLLRFGGADYSSGGWEEAIDMETQSHAAYTSPARPRASSVPHLAWWPSSKRAQRFSTKEIE
jgi:hypothetical protein